MLVMAVETLLKLQPRPESSLAHVEHLIGLTQAADLPKSEKSSLLDSLKWLRDQSIGQAGRALAATLGDRTYTDMTPPKFFAHCYDLRSRWSTEKRHFPSAKRFVLQPGSGSSPTF
jgi:hypothetical protein